jgi:hypothetical protein
MRGADASGLDDMLEQVKRMIVELGGEALDIQSG